MSLPLPESARIEIPPALSRDMSKAAEALPAYDNLEYYNFDRQQSVYESIRTCCRAGFDWLVDEVQSRIDAHPYCALVKGLDFDEANRLFVGVNRAFGDLVARPYEKPRAQLVHYIQPSTDLRATQGSRYESEKLHTDTADWEPPVKLISMICVRPDAGGGGRSRVLDVDTLRDEVERRLGATALASLTTTPVPWMLAPYRGGGIQHRPILSESTVCWRRYTIDLALNTTGTELSEDFTVLLDDFGTVVDSTGGTLEFLMCPNELLFVDNRRTLHARTALSSDGPSNRLMIRSWIHTPDD